MGWTGSEWLNLPQRSVDPTIVPAIAAALQEAEGSVAQVAGARGETSGLKSVNWSGDAADEHRQRLDEAAEHLRAASGALSALKESLVLSLAEAQRRVAADEQALRAWLLAPRDASGRLL